MYDIFLCFLSSTAPGFYFGDTDYRVDESDGYVEVKVYRTGTDLSKTATVTVRSRKTDPVSAEGRYNTTLYNTNLCMSMTAHCLLKVGVPVPTIKHTALTQGTVLQSTAFVLQHTGFSAVFKEPYRA